MIYKHLATFPIGHHDIQTYNNLHYRGAMIYEHPTTFPIGHFDIRTSSNLPYRGVMMHKHLTAAIPIKELWNTNI